MKLLVGDSSIVVVEVSVVEILVAGSFRSLFYLLYMYEIYVTNFRILKKKDQQQCPENPKSHDLSVLPDPYTATSSSALRI
jgi:hypothetical protein